MPPDVVIDSWEDLAQTNLKIVAHAAEVKIFDYEFERKEYFSKLSPFYEDFTQRLTLEPAWKYINIEDRLELYEKLCEKSDFVLMRGDLPLLYNWNYLKNGFYRNKLHVSKHGANVMPVFLSTNITTGDRKREILHYWYEKL